MKISARASALRVLVSCRTNSAWADAALKAQIIRDGLSGPDAALCSRIVYGVMQNRMLLDFYIGAYCSQKPDHLQPPLLDILRIGAYQILYLDKIPDSAAVNESVELAKMNKRGQAAGLVNAVLRKISKNKNELPPIPDKDAERYLSIRYSHPKWLVKRLVNLLGREEAEAFLAADNGVAPMTIQYNPLKTTQDALEEELSQQGVDAKRHSWVPGCLELSGTGDLTALPAFREGKFVVQDGAARLVSLGGLGGVDLIKRLGRNAKTEAAQVFLNVPRAVQHAALLAQQQAGALIVHILHHGGDLRVLGQQGVDKLGLLGEIHHRRHQHHHNLAAGKAALNQHVTQKTLHGHVVKGAQFKAFQQFADGDDDLVRLGILDETAIHRDNLMGGGLVNAGDNLPVALAKGGLHLIAIVVGVIHTDDLVHVAVFAQQFNHLDLLMAELALVGHIL